MPEPNPEKRLNWERFRFAIIGPLLAAPPQAGELQGQLRVLAQKQWIHPCDPTRHLRVSRSTIERWYYKALRSKNPVDALKRRKRADYRKTRVVSPTVLALLEQQYQQNPHWSVQLHHDNLRAVAHEDAKLVIPSYSTLLRVMRKCHTRYHCTRPSITRTLTSHETVKEGGWNNVKESKGAQQVALLERSPASL